MLLLAYSPRLMCFVHRSSYGPVRLDASESGSIITNFTLGYALSTVEAYLNGESYYHESDAYSWASGSAIEIAGGTQNFIEFIVTNQESAVSTTYDLTVIRPLTQCTASELSDW